MLSEYMTLHYATNGRMFQIKYTETPFKTPIESPYIPVLILLDTKYEIMHVSFGNLCGVRLSIHFSVLCRTYVGEVPQIKTYLVIDKHVYEIH